MSALLTFATMFLNCEHVISLIVCGSYAVLSDMECKGLVGGLVC